MLVVTIIFYFWVFLFGYETLRVGSTYVEYAAPMLGLIFKMSVIVVTLYFVAPSTSFGEMMMSLIEMFREGKILLTTRHLEVIGQVGAATFIGSAIGNFALYGLALIKNGRADVDKRTANIVFGMYTLHLILAIPGAVRGHWTIPELVIITAYTPVSMWVYQRFFDDGSLGSVEMEELSPNERKFGWFFNPFNSGIMIVEFALSLRKPKTELGIAVHYMMVGVIAVAVGSVLLVNSTSYFGGLLGIPEFITSLTILAGITSLSEAFQLFGKRSDSDSAADEGAAMMTMSNEVDLSSFSGTILVLSLISESLGLGPVELHPAVAVGFVSLIPYTLFVLGVLVMNLGNISGRARGTLIVVGYFVILAIQVYYNFFMI